MKVKVNSEVLDFPKGENIDGLMHLLYPGEKNGKAVAIANKVIPTSLWNTTEIKENDNILIITATQGG